MPQQGELPPFVKMMNLLTAKFYVKPLYAVAKLGIADLLADGPRSSDELARETKSSPDALYRVLRAAGMMGVLEEQEGRKFALTELGALLKSGPRSLRSMALWLNDPLHDQVWEEFMSTVETGHAATFKAWGADVFRGLQARPELFAIFNDAMTNFATAGHSAVIDAYDFSPFRTLVDVGGGHGALMSAVLGKFQDVRGIVFDLPRVVEGTPKLLAQNGLSDRCEVVGGDFFESVPPADAHMMSVVIHDWDDEKAIAILRNCRKAQSTNGKVLVIETIVPPVGQPGFAKLLDMEMLVMAGGRERTREEYEALFKASGLRLNRIVETRSPVFVLEGVHA